MLPGYTLIHIPAYPGVGRNHIPLPQVRFKYKQIQNKLNRENNMENNMDNKIEERKDMKEERKGNSQIEARKTVSTTPSSWWEDRKNIGQPGSKRVEGEEMKGNSQIEARKTVSTTPSSWWEDRKKIEQPGSKDQKKSIYEPEKQMGVNVEEKKDISQIMCGSHTAFSRMFEDSYLTLYKNWLEFGKSYQIPTLESRKETFEKLLSSAEESKRIYMSCIAELEENSRAAREVLQGEKGNANPEAYKEFYTLWAKTYEKAFDNFFENMPTASPFKEVLEPVKNAARIYSDTFTSISRMWMSYPCFTGAV